MRIALVSQEYPPETAKGGIDTGHGAGGVECSAQHCASLAQDGK